MSDLRLNGLTFAYGESRILSELSLALPPRSLIGIVGPNGCGKSTLLSLLANLRPPTAGQITLDGKDLRKWPRRSLAKRIAYLPQAPIAPEGIQVVDVLRYGRWPHQSMLRQFSANDSRKIEEIAQLLHLGPLLQTPMEKLSGGQRQKAWLGMTLVQDTDIVLLDEPTSALDIGHQHDVLSSIRQIRDLGKTVVMVIHDLGAAARFCDTIVALKDGNIRHFGTPQTVMTADLILELYGVHVEILAAGPGGAPVLVPLRLAMSADGVR